MNLETVVVLIIGLLLPVVIWIEDFSRSLSGLFRFLLFCIGAALWCNLYAFRKILQRRKYEKDIATRNGFIILFSAVC